MTDPEPLSRRFALALHRATALVDRVADAHLRPAHGIGVSELAALASIDALEPARQSALAAALDVSRSAVTQRLASLTRDGLVVVVADPGDRRANSVALTPSGRALLTAAWESLARHDDGLEDGVDVAGLIAALDRVAANAERHLAGTGRR
ncbi:MarR family winged helix-turn-helix transcriptional regulator [Nocardioides sp. zg-1228]|uniref:MarR family winged helix-turn-helix transcriptional regulator n=1 Tax=Nocardioides sp. zg-1228 TaxID=2763008 RepID=UPI001642E1E5|nr:MarR family winged helix-turn-helix transcriptional regulator [Nocardioides sp. zg-1228]MBC2933812.1 winged helix-turn-helix transcriptional regulator [Nocardioides sp. zg-1228]QSF58585.1 winged helix-turn-helix transcriptional regulator [Nocardioides sp. zg-1228]